MAGILVWVLLAICTAVLSARFVNGVVEAGGIEGDVADGSSDSDGVSDAPDVAGESDGPDGDETDVDGQLQATAYVPDVKTGIGGAALLLVTAFTAVVAAQTAVSVVAYAELGLAYLAVLSTAIIDGKLHRIPNAIPLALVVLRLCCFVYEFFLVPEALGYLTSALLGGFLCFVTLSIARRVSHNGVGAGDVKLVSAMGLMCGLYFIIYTLLFSLVICAVTAGVLMVLKLRHRDGSLPFAPFLFVGFVCALCIGLL